MNGHRIQRNGHQNQINGHQIQINGHRIQMNGHWIQMSGHQKQIGQIGQIATDFDEWSSKSGANWSQKMDQN